MAGVVNELEGCWGRAAAMPFSISQPLNGIICTI